MNRYTLEELALIGIFNRGSRKDTEQAIGELVPHLGDDPMMRNLALSVLEKLSRMSEKEYSLLMADYEPIYENTAQEETDEQ